MLLRVVVPIGRRFEIQKGPACQLPAAHCGLASQVPAGEARAGPEGVQALPALGLGALLLGPRLHAPCSLHSCCCGGHGAANQGGGSSLGNTCSGPATLIASSLPQEYEQASKVDQFVTRFLLRETVSQLQALQSSLEGASETLEVQARGLRYVRACQPGGPPRECPLSLHSRPLVSSHSVVPTSWSPSLWAGCSRRGSWLRPVCPTQAWSYPRTPVLGPEGLGAAG